MMMSIPYFDKNQEGVRQVALKCFDRLTNGFIKTLKSISYHKERDDRGYLTFKCEKSDIEIIIREYEKELDERNKENELR